jgi:hypothetical protein
MPRSRFLSSTSLALAIAASGATGCGGSDDNTCGPGNAPEVGLTATGGATTLSFGELTSGINNDCPTANTPEGVISVTIFGVQTGGTGTLTLCIARPDLLARQAQPLVEELPGLVGVHVVNLNAMANGCSFSIDTAQPITGSATSTGLCDNGANPSGFALTLDGALSFKRTCGTTTDTLNVALAGSVAVAKQ